MNAILKKKYREKAIDSFNTKLNLYLFAKAIKLDWEHFSLSDFQDFEIDRTLVDIYTTEFWQYEPDYEIQDGLTNDLVYRKIASEKEGRKIEIGEFRDDYIENRFSLKLPILEFEKLIQQESCAYCQITIDEIVRLANRKKLHKKNYRGWTLEIDRKDSNLEYTPDNCVMACYWCNNAKTDEFTFEEFKEIGAAIRKIWENRLG